MNADRKPWLTGSVDPKSKRLLQELMKACGPIEDGLRRKLSGFTQHAAAQLYTDLSSVAGTLLDHVSQKGRRSSIAAALMMRGVLEACISIFAFCKDTTRRGTMYLNFVAVLEWKFRTYDEKHPACPLLRRSQSGQEGRAQRKAELVPHLKTFGSKYWVKKRKEGQTKEQYKEAFAKLEVWKPSTFRNTWFPERRCDVLQEEGMGWVHDVLYKRLSSAVHTDPAGSLVFGDLRKDNVYVMCLELWAAALYRLVDELRVNISAVHKGVFRGFYNGLKGEVKP